jgi:hypothetical protein
VSRSWWKFEDGVISGCIKTTQTAAGAAIGDHAMTKNTATSTSALLANEVGYDPIEDRLRLNIRATIGRFSRRNWSSFWAAAGMAAGARQWPVTATDTESGS